VGSIKGGKEMYGKVNKVKSALAEGRVALGTWVQMPSPEIVEAIGYQGFDYVIIDLEHGGFGLDTLPSMVRAAEAAGVTPIVRVPILEESTILWVLNTGAMGVQIPGISTREQAEQAVRFAKYYPEGTRGANPWVRSTQYNVSDWGAYTKRSNKETMVWLMIEGKEGIENFDEILEVPNIDAIVPGRFDISQSLGIPGQVDHPMLLETVKKMVEKAKQKNIETLVSLLSEVTQPEIEQSVKMWHDCGVKIMSVMGDRGVICTGFRNCLAYAKHGLA
jgi:4-hydroxy-2-oxoheptanedioate aldolase